MIRHTSSRCSKACCPASMLANDHSCTVEQLVGGEPPQSHRFVGLMKETPEVEPEDLVGLNVNDSGTRVAAQRGAVVMEYGRLVEERPYLTGLETLHPVDVGEDTLHGRRVAACRVPGRVPHHIHLPAFEAVGSLGGDADPPLGSADTLRRARSSCSCTLFTSSKTKLGFGSVSPISLPYFMLACIPDSNTQPPPVPRSLNLLRRGAWASRPPSLRSRRPLGGGRA